jgi:hypothetical protein
LDTLPLTGRRAATTLAVVRGVGAPGWFVPTLTCKVLGLPRNSEQTRNYWFRLFVSRDVALAGWLMATEAGSEQRRLALRTGIAVDVADAAAWVLAVRRGELPRLGAVALAALHVGAIALGALALRDDPATG